MLTFAPCLRGRNRHFFALAASSASISPSWSRSSDSNPRGPRNSRREMSPSRLRSILRNQDGPAAAARSAGADIILAAANADMPTAGDLAPADRQLVVVGDLVGADLAVAVAVPRRDARDRVADLAHAETAVAIQIHDREDRTALIGDREDHLAPRGLRLLIDERVDLLHVQLAVAVARPSCRTARRTGRGPSPPTSRGTCCCRCRRPGTGRHSSSWRSRRRARRRRRGTRG